MSPLVLVVDDNETILFNIKLFLDMQNFQTLTATNGQEALDALKKASHLPDMIISDIMMPVMDGYEFYKQVSEHSEWSTIPFVFVSAKSSPEDIRLAKKLGVDDYITKPFEVDDLLAVIQGKIQKSQKKKKMQKQFEEKLREVTKGKEELPSDAPKGNPVLFLMDWDEKIGPRLIDYYPRSVSSDDIEKIGLQLYSISVGFYGNEDYSKADGTLIRMYNHGVDAYIFFDSTSDTQVRGNQRLYMFVFVAPRINYLEALRIKDLLKDIATLYKNQKPLQLQECWGNIMETMK